MISPEKNDDIPTKVIKSVVVPASNDRLVSIGDCITGLEYYYQELLIP